MKRALTIFLICVAQALLPVHLCAQNLDLKWTKGNLPVSRIVPGVSGQCLTTDVNGDTVWGSCAAGSGTVTTFAAGNLTPLFSTSVSNSTSTPSLAFTLTNAAAHSFFGNNTATSAAPSYVQPSSTDLADFSTTAATTAGQIPIFDGSKYVPGDPLVQGLFADGSTSSANPVIIGGYDTAGTPAQHRAIFLNSTPSGTEYGIVTRPIPSGTQTVSGSVSVSNFPATQPVSGTVSVSNFPATQPVSGTVTANAGTGTFTTNLSAIGGTSVSGANVVDAANAAFKVNCVTGCSATSGFTDNSAFTAASTTENNIGGVFNDGLAAVTSGNGAAARITAQRAMHVNLRNNSGTEIGTSTTPLQVSLANTAANTTAVKVDGSAVTQPVSGSVSVSNFPGTQPVSGTVTANAGTGTFNIQQSNITADYDTGVGNQTLTMFGLALPASGGAVAGGTATNPVQISIANTGANATAVKVDGSAVTQPVSGTVTVQQSTASSLKVDLSGTGANATALKVDGSAVTQPVSNTGLTDIDGAITTDGSAAPANDVQTGGKGSGNLKAFLNCDGYAFYDAATNGATQLVALTTGQTIYVCGYSFTSSSTTANTVKLVYGTGANCATGQTAMTPGLILQAAASSGPAGKVVPPSGQVTGLKTAASNALCVLTNAAAAAQVEVWYTKQ